MKEFTLKYGSPKKMTLELSEDGTYYNAKFYLDFFALSKTCEGWIELQLDVPAVNNMLKVRDYDYSEDNKIFSIILTDEEQEK